VTSLISKFLASKWVTVALIAALAAGAYYVYSQGVKLGSASEALASYKETVTEQQGVIDTLLQDGQRMQAITSEQSARLQQLERNSRVQELALREALKNADKETKDCMSMRLADGLQFGPSSQDSSGDGEARSDVDG